MIIITNKIKDAYPNEIVVILSAGDTYGNNTIFTKK